MIYLLHYKLIHRMLKKTAWGYYGPQAVSFYAKFNDIYFF